MERESGVGGDWVVTNSQNGCNTGGAMQRLAWLFLLLLAEVPLLAERYAVLAGVSEYRIPDKYLEGPAHDIAALRTLLLQHGYDAPQVTVLVNKEATRNNILRALRHRVSQLQPGDHLFFYFSGHGTSAFDTNNEPLAAAIGPDSGALVAHDLAVDSLEAAVQSLIIGQRDLRPILSRVPPEAQAFVVLDACYSELASKAAGVMQNAPARGITLVGLPPGKGRTNGRAPGGAAVPSRESAGGGAYPYPNVVSFAAASRNQKALDINSELLRKNVRTMDGKPHGAMTNSLLAGLAGRGDTNRDGLLTYDELFRFLRRDMEQYPHQPQLLAATGFALHQPVLGRRAAPPAPPVEAAVPAAPRPAVRTRVRLEKATPELRARLAALSEVELVTDACDLLVRAAEGRWDIHDASGVLVQTMPREPIDGVVERVQAHGRLALLQNWTSAGQSFNVRIDVEPATGTGYDRLRTTFRMGEEVRVRLGTEQPAHLLLLGINKHGKVAVLFPGAGGKEQGLQAPGQPVEFLIRATPPAGVDQLKLIGFAQRPAQWADWGCTSATACPEFAAGDARMASLMTMLRGSTGTAEASLRVITQE